MRTCAPARTSMDSRAICCGVFVVLSVQLVGVRNLSAADWPQSRRDAARTGRTPELGLRDPVIHWTTDVGAPLSGEPVVAGCQLLVADGAAEVVARSLRPVAR